MNALKIIAIALIIAGGPELSYGGRRDTREIQQNPRELLALLVHDRPTVTLPAWDGLMAMALGVVLLLAPEYREPPAGESGYHGQPMEELNHHD